MGVTVSDARSVKQMNFDQVTNFPIFRNDGLRQIVHFSQNLPPISQAAQGHFANDDRMHHHLGLIEQMSKERVGDTEMISPD